MSLENWRQPDKVRALLERVQTAEKSGTLATSADLRTLSWSSDQELLSLLDELASAGYLLGRPHPGNDEHFFEYSELRLGSRGKAALADE